MMPATMQEAATVLYFSGYIRNYERLSRELGLPTGLGREER